MTPREEILDRIRTALRDDRPPAAPIPRDYRRTDERPLPELLDVLAERLVDYRALVRRCAPPEVATVVATALRERGVRHVVLPPGLPGDWAGGAEGVVDDGTLTAADLDAVDGVVTTCAVAIAETGTLVLDSSLGQGRRALTLVPDYHLCVVTADRVVGSVPEALQRIEPTRPLTFVSGPSATSDIELERVEGVHGPRTLEVVLVDEH